MTNIIASIKLVNTVNFYYKIFFFKFNLFKNNEK